MDPMDGSADDGSDLTVSKASLLAMRAGAAPVSGPTALTVAFGTGESLALTGRMVVGRSPATGPGDVPVAVTDLAVSKTHLAIEPAPGAAWVTDLHSRNGVTLALPDGQEVELVPGRPTFAAIGTRVLFGGSAAEIVAAAVTEPMRPSGGDAESTVVSPKPAAAPAGSSAAGPLIAEVPLT